MRKSFTTTSKEETRQVGERLGKLIQKPLVILLYGDLGAGKTTLTQGVARGLGVARTINSPTFNLLKIYQGRLPLYHIDAYRLEGIHQDLGFEEYLEDTDGVTIVEWPMYIQDLLPDHWMKITISIDEQDHRVFQVETNGTAEEKLGEEWLG